MKRSATQRLGNCWSVACVAGLAAGFASSVVLIGCASPLSESTRLLVAEDFVATSPTGVGQSQSAVGDTQLGAPASGAITDAPSQPFERVWEPVAGLSRSQGFSPSLGPRGALSLSARAGAPDLPAPEAGDTQQRNVSVASTGRLVDAKVGEVHGVPIFVSEFFDDAFLALVRAEAPEARSEWRKYVRQGIAVKLSGEITDILLRERARSQLTSRQRMGLLGVLQGYRSDLQSSSEGNRALADQRLYETTGQTVREAVDERESQVLIRFELDEVFSRSIVPSAEIRRAYDRLDRESDMFTPDPVLMLRLIRVETEDAEKVRLVKDKLAQRVPFVEVASLDVNRFRAKEGGLQRADNAGPIAKASPFSGALEPVNELVRTLSPGQWKGPVETGAFTNWVYLDRIENNEMSLYDAQFFLANRLRQERFIEDRNRHIEKLKLDVNFEEETAMVDRLLSAVEGMFFPPN